MPSIQLLDLLSMSAPQGPDPCMEVERDAQGRPIPDPLTGYKLTNRAIEASRKKFEDAVRTHPPMEEIPRKYVPTLTQQNKPLLYWGLPFTDEQMLACLLRNELMEWDPEKSNRTVALFTVLDYLEERCGVKLTLEQPLSVDYPHVVSLYSNFTMADTVMRRETEERAVAIIREELGVQDQPRWWWDWATAYKRRRY